MFNQPNISSSYTVFQNLPFGETMVELGGIDYDNPYKFNGKELDEETGNYYYGARYYNPKVSQWLSVDPLAEKYAGFSPYNYTLNNPVMLVDPNGMSVDPFTKVSQNTSQPSLPSTFTPLYIATSGPGDPPKVNTGSGTAVGDNVANQLDVIVLTYSHTSHTATTGRRRFRQRRRNRRRFFSGSLFFDSRGQEILSHWLAGSGTNLILDNEEWQEYMRSNELLNSQIHDVLYEYINGIRDDVKKGGILPFHLRFHGEIENGYMTGYEMLHGSDSRLGDTQIYGIVQYNSNTKQFDFILRNIWNDRINPNRTYQEDVTLANILNKFYSPQDYNVKIIWHEKINIK